MARRYDIEHIFPVLPVHLQNSSVPLRTARPHVDFGLLQLLLNLIRREGGRRPDLALP